MDCKCRGEVGQWEKCEIAAGCKFRGDDGSVGEE